MNESTRRPVLLTAETAEKILHGDSRVSVDLGLSQTAVTMKGSFAVFQDGRRVSLDGLRGVLRRQDKVFILVSSRLYPLEISDSHYYKLVPTSDAPALEIDGVRMHRTKDITPLEESRRKVEALGVQGGTVLEVGTGLGYTARAALEAGAHQIVSIEVNLPVLQIARLNPWSWKTFADERMYVIAGEAYHLLSSFRVGFCDYVVHDPPRISLAGHLYGSDFYALLFRVLKPGGRLYHYLGEPGSKYRGRNIRPGVVRRLREKGFVGVRYHDEIKGLTCTKPL